MQDPMDQFLSALRGLENVKTPLSVEIPTSTSVTPDSQRMKVDPSESGTEEDAAIRYEKLRRLKVDQLSKARRGQTKS